MSRTYISALILFVSALILFSSNTGYAQDKKIPLKKVPAKVLAAFHKAYPKGEIKGTSIESENGHHYYEIESVEGTKNRDMLVTRSGKITEVETTISETELPQPVMKTLNTKFKSLKIIKAEEVKSGNKVTYELTIESNNKKHGITILPDGKILKSSSAEKENEKGEKGEKGESEENDND